MYFNPTITTVGVFQTWSTANAEYTVSGLAVGKVIIPPATGCILVNNAAAETFISLPTAFNPNAIANITVHYMGDN